MKLAVNTEQIIDGVLKAAAIIPAKAGAAYLRSIWLKAENNELSIMSTDVNIEFRGVYPAEVEQPGLLGVQGRSFADLVRRLPSGVMHLSSDDESGVLQIQQGKRNYRLPVSGAEWFQDFADFPVENSVAWSGDILLEIIEKVSYCIEDEDTRDGLCCLYFKPCGNGRIESCGLNGHQFALFSFIHDDLAALLGEKGLLIQKKYLPDIKKWLGPDEIELNVSEKRVFFKRQEGAEILSVPRALHEYPDYNIFLAKLSGDTANILAVPRKECMDSLGRILVFNTESERGVFLDMTESELNLSAQGADMGSARESLEVSYGGDISRIVFPTRELLEIMGHFSSEFLDFKFSGAEGPAGIQGPGDPDYRVVIMPMKVAESSYYTEEK